MMEDCPCKGPGAETFLLGSNGEKKQTNDALKVEVLREGSKFHHSAEDSDCGAWETCPPGSER